MLPKAGLAGRGISRQLLASPGAAHIDGKYTNTTPSPSGEAGGPPRWVTNTAATISAPPNARQSRGVMRDLMPMVCLRRSSACDGCARGYHWHEPAAQRRQRFIERAEATEFTV